jgi:hypothetical protein
MKTFFKWTFRLLLLAFIIIQFFRPEKNKAEGMSKKDISTLYPVPQDVQAILKTSCFDCHSNNTVYPWYAEVQPFGWWLNEHILDGKKDLNFSEFAGYRIRKQYRKLEEINELVEKDAMPLNSYLWIHKDARLNAQQKQTLTKWVDAVRDTIKANYPPDSLIRK